MQSDLVWVENQQEMDWLKRQFEQHKEIFYWFIGK